MKTLVLLAVLSWLCLLAWWLYIIETHPRESLKASSVCTCSFSG